MIEQRDLDAAVGAGIVDAATAARLVDFTRDYRRGQAGPDEEAFRLLTGFNDIFVTIAIGLLLFALGALGGRIAPAVGAALVAAASWGLAEYFTRQRRMALPSIALLLAFVSGVFCRWRDPDRTRIGGRDGVRWKCEARDADRRRSAMPLGAAASPPPPPSPTGGGSTCRSPSPPGPPRSPGWSLALVSAVAVVAPDVLLVLILLAGLAVFALAMHFDARDRARVTRWSDVAFWLHLLAAPMIIHPVFALAGLLHGTPGPGAAVLAIAVYAALTLVALAIDRRALLVSALGYVIYAIQALVAAGGALDLSLALTALVIGGFLVLLSAAWRPIRGRVIALLPATLTARLPVAAV